ncbi:hypothetical protein [Caballeronia ptereochthonis]|uniref:Uncharacterized protein n=1 Tax=Caballeronia ptereochthonis TaxID=1777144 RepID=A0A158C0I7_9BURK|nr:hypothetical protein [Caballeronia ptereochthonis]SAK75875.1 hypothetical protein AWB83_03870 [Caballeronia ptereochthonis]
MMWKGIAFTLLTWVFLRALCVPAGIGMAASYRAMVSAGKDMSVAISAGFNVNPLRAIALAAKGAKVALFDPELGQWRFVALDGLCWQGNG